jgi:hypothetical protein
VQILSLVSVVGALLDLPPAMASQIFGTAAHVPFAPRWTKQWSTSYSIVCSQGRCGFGSYELLASNIPLPCTMKHSRTGGASAGREYLSSYRVVLTLLQFLRIGAFGGKRNNRIFNSAMGHTAQLTSWIMEEARCWSVAGFRHLLA